MPWESRPGTKNLYYTQKKRVGRQIISAYYGTGEAAVAIAQVEDSLKLGRQFECFATNLVSRALIVSGAANEANFNEVESRLIEALTAAGYHRQNRGPWRKARTNKSVITPNAEHQAPASAFDLLLPLESLLTDRIRACREHCANIEAAYASAGVRTATLRRQYQRTAARAHKRLTSAEASLLLLHGLAVREQ